MQLCIVAEDIYIADIGTFILSMIMLMNTILKL